MTRTNVRSNSGYTVLIILLIIFTFPIWIGIAGGLFGLMAGLFGAAIGIIAAIFGVIGAILAAFFGSVFGVFNWFSFPHIHFGGVNVLLAVALVFAIVLLSKAQKKK